jgi:hypothetical protein
MDSNDPWGLRGGEDEERYRENGVPSWGRTSPDLVPDAQDGQSSILSTCLSVLIYVNHLGALMHLH